MVRHTIVRGTRRVALPRHAARRIAIALLVAGGSAGAQTHFIQTNLVSDVPGLAVTLDAQLKNPWGTSFGATSAFWVSDNHTGLATLYNGLGTTQSLVVSIPGGSPTGQVNNNAGAFQLSNGSNAAFLFATENGTIAGWNGPAGTTALTAATASSAGSSYTGLAISGTGASARLYAANFGAGRVDVFDGSFTPVLAGAFNDPLLPAGFSPFNVQNLNGSIFVAYDLRDPNTGDEVHGAGLGQVDMFDLSGNLLRRIAVGGSLNSPWGMAIAPSTFGGYAGALLVGSNGNGTISAFLQSNGANLGVLTDTTGAPIVNEGLWALTPGNGANAGGTGQIFLTDGLNGEDNGLFGSLSTSTPEPGSLGLLATGLVALVGVTRRRSRRAQRGS